MKTIKILAVAFAATLVVSCSKEAVVNEKVKSDEVPITKARPYFNDLRVFFMTELHIGCFSSGGNCLPDLVVTPKAPEGTGGNNSGKAFEIFKEKVSLDRVPEFFADNLNTNILFGQMMKRYPKEF